MNEAIFLGRNTTQVKEHNIRALLLFLLQNENVSRVELAEKTSLSTTTITNLIEELIDQGVVIEDGPGEVTGRRTVGRPRSEIRLQKDAYYAIGVHIGFGIFRIAIVNLVADVIDDSRGYFDIGDSAENVMESIAEQIKQIIIKNKIKQNKLIGVGIGAPGLVNYKAGSVIYSLTLKWNNINIQKILQSHLKFPVVVDNNVRTMALGESFFGLGKSYDSLVFIYGRIGVAAGIVVNDKVYRGSGLGAGEVGHMVVMAENGKLCRCGRKGCLETLASVPYIIENAKIVCEQKPQSPLCQYLSNTDEIMIDRVFLAAREGDFDAKKIIKKSASYLGIALANLVNLLNPELIVLGGIYAQEADLFIPEAECVMRQGSVGNLGKEVILKPTPFVWKAGMIGAASLALLSFFYQEYEEI